MLESSYNQSYSINSTLEMRVFWRNFGMKSGKTIHNITSFLPTLSMSRPLVERINDCSPTHSRLFKEMILVASPLKPFEISAKNTPRRMAVLTAYQDEIKQAYASADKCSQPDIPLPEIWEIEECLVFVRCAVRRVMQVPVSDDEDIFQAGCDRFVEFIQRKILVFTGRQSSSHLDTQYPLTRSTAFSQGVHFPHSTELCICQSHHPEVGNICIARRGPRTELRSPHSVLKENHRHGEARPEI